MSLQGRHIVLKINLTEETTMQKKYLDRLSRLADFLENNVKNDQFNIKYYRTDEYGKCTTFYSKHNCGTVGCALGWAPFAFKLNKTYRDFDGEYFFPKISEKFLGINDRESWVYLFDSKWFYTPQATRKATIKRIRNFVNNNGNLDKRMINLMDKYNVY